MAAENIREDEINTFIASFVHSVLYKREYLSMFNGSNSASTYSQAPSQLRSLLRRPILGLIGLLTFAWAMAATDIDLTKFEGLHSGPVFAEYHLLNTAAAETRAAQSWRVVVAVGTVRYRPLGRVWQTSTEDSFGLGSNSVGGGDSGSGSDGGGSGSGSDGGGSGSGSGGGSGSGSGSDSGGDSDSGSGGGSGGEPDITICG